MKKILVICFLLVFSVGCSNNTANKQEVKPIAIADVYATNKNTKIIISDWRNNDTTQNSTMLASFDNISLKNGKIIKTKDDSFSYTPPNSFTGTDTFTYTICNDTSKKNCATTTVTIHVIESSVVFKIPANLADYYKGISFSTNKKANKHSLKSIIVNYTVLSYGSRHKYLYKADADLAKPDNVILMYTGKRRYWKEYTSGLNKHNPQTFNTEHVYPRSKLSSKNANTDLHHLRTCDAKVNSKRSNFPFVDGSGKSQLKNRKWYPGDEWKGDVARMIFYLNLVHKETFDKVGSLELFLKWNIEDPVSNFEIQRNNEIYKAQKNRNPFIDNPYLATLIYGGKNAENKWK